MSDTSLVDRKLEAALFDGTGTPVPITKIEIEPLPREEGFRWSLYSGPQRIYSTTGSLLDIRAAMEDTATLVESELGLPPPADACTKGA